jgi:demethylsterigmatocystin 6-O-methyltransferase
MQASHGDRKSWLDTFRFEQLCQNSNPETPIFVDVGGGIGHQCAELKARLPDIQGRVILQDLSPAVQHALSTEGVENMVIDFWHEQPIKGKSGLFWGRKYLITF